MEPVARVHALVPIVLARLGRGGLTFGSLNACLLLEGDGEVDRVSAGRDPTESKTSLGLQV